MPHRYQNLDQTIIEIGAGGLTDAAGRHIAAGTLVPKDPANADYAALIESGVVIADPAPPVLDGAARLHAIKACARQRILALAPEWKQANLIARAAELALVYPQLRGADLPEPERAEYLAGQAVWTAIKAIRAASDSIEQDDRPMTLAEIENDARWPQ